MKEMWTVIFMLWTIVMVFKLIDVLIGWIHNTDSGNVFGWTVFTFLGLLSAYNIFF